MAILQSLVSVVAPEVRAVFWNKNAEYESTRSQRVCRFIPCGHGVHAAQRRTTITSLLHRAAASTPSWCTRLLLPVMLQLRLELHSLGYPATLFDMCLRKFVFARKHQPCFPAWHSLWQRFHAGVAMLSYI